MNVKVYKNYVLKLYKISLVSTSNSNLIGINNLQKLFENHKLKMYYRIIDRKYQSRKLNV